MRAARRCSACACGFRVPFSWNRSLIVRIFVACADRYQNELPKKIKSRGKDAHLVHEELVQTMKWKQIVSRVFSLLELHIWSPFQ